MHLAAVVYVLCIMKQYVEVCYALCRSMHYAVECPMQYAEVCNMQYAVVNKVYAVSSSMQYTQ